MRGSGQRNNRQELFVLEGIWVKHRKELIDKLALASARPLLPQITRPKEEREKEEEQDTT